MSNSSITIKADDINIAPVSYDYIMNSINQSTVAHINANIFNPQTNCRNCGAPLNRNRDCEYCGTQFQTDDRIASTTPPKSELVITGSEIRVSVG